MIFKDRVTATPHRYTLANVSGSTYDLTAVPGAISEEGTALNAENLSQVDTLWQPSETIILFNAEAGVNTFKLASGDETHTYATAGYYYVKISGLEMDFGDGNTTTLSAFTGFNINNHSSAYQYIEAYLGNTCPCGDYSFRGCLFLSKVEFAKGLLGWAYTSIGISVFRGCYFLQNIIIPVTVTSIGDYAFYDCYRLQNLIIPDSVISIGDYAFYDCYDLQSVMIPNSVTSIGDYGFERCYGLNKLRFEAISPFPTLGTDSFKFCKITDIICGTSALAISAKSALLTAGATLLDGYRLLPGDKIKGSATVLTTDWAADATYTAYPFRATVTVTGLTADYTGLINYDDTALALGTLKDGGKTYAGGFYVYVSEVPAIDIEIESYIFWEVS